MFLALGLTFISIGIIGALSGFRPGDHSTRAQRGIIIAWIVSVVFSELLVVMLLLILCLAYLEPPQLCMDCGGRIGLWMPTPKDDSCEDALSD